MHHPFKYGGGEAGPSGGFKGYHWPPRQPPR